MTLEPEIKAFMTGIAEDPRFARFVAAKEIEFYEKWKHAATIDARESVYEQQRAFLFFVNELKSLQNELIMGDRKR